VKVGMDSTDLKLKGAKQAGEGYLWLLPNRRRIARGKKLFEPRDAVHGRMASIRSKNRQGGGANG